MGMMRLSFKRTLFFSLSAPVRHAREILPRIIPIWIIGCLLVYGVMFVYFQQLLRFLAAPSDRTGSLVLGIAAGGALIGLFLHSMISATITGALIGRPGKLHLVPHLRRRDWRLYAANLRLVLLLATGSLLYAVGSLLRSGPIVSGLATLVGLALTVLLVLRVWFLLAPVSIHNREGAVLRPSWRLSRGQCLPVLALVCTLMLPGLAIEGLAEIGLHEIGVKSAPGGTSMASMVVFYCGWLPVMLGVLALSYLVTVLLMTAARLDVYRQLIGHDG
jgi:hypothetical protein